MAEPQGAFVRKLDGGCRFIMPEALLGVYPRKLVLTPDFDGCVRGYAPKQWESFDAELNKLNPYHPDQANLIRFFRGMATTVELDSNDRVKISEALAKHAGVEDGKCDILIYDAGPYLEIWHTERWAEFMGQRTDSMKDLARQFFGGMVKGGEEAHADGGSPPAGNGQ